MLHDAISSDALNPAPFDPDSAWTALTSVISKPSALGDGIEVAGDVPVSILGGPKPPGEEEKEEEEPLPERQLQEEEEETIAPMLGTALSGGLSEDAANSATQPSSFPKPEGIPDDWIEKPSNDGEGMQWINPDNPNDRVRVMPGNPDAEFDSHKEPYVIDQNGGFLDVNGNLIYGSRPGNTPEAHIPCLCMVRNPLNPGSAWAALTSAIDRPSVLGDGVQVAGDIPLNIP